MNRLTLWMCAAIAASGTLIASFNPLSARRPALEVRSAYAQLDTHNAAPDGGGTSSTSPSAPVIDAGKSPGLAKALEGKLTCEDQLQTAVNFAGKTAEEKAEAERLRQKLDAECHPQPKEVKAAPRIVKPKAPSKIIACGSGTVRERDVCVCTVPPLPGGTAETDVRISLGHESKAPVDLYVCYYTAVAIERYVQRHQKVHDDLCRADRLDRLDNREKVEGECAQTGQHIIDLLGWASTWDAAKLRAEIDDHEKRLKSLEDWRLEKDKKDAEQDARLDNMQHQVRVIAGVLARGAFRPSNTPQVTHSLQVAAHPGLEILVSDNIAFVLNGELGAAFNQNNKSTLLAGGGVGVEFFVSKVVNIEPRVICNAEIVAAGSLGSNCFVEGAVGFRPVRIFQIKPFVGVGGGLTPASRTVGVLPTAGLQLDFVL